MKDFPSDRMITDHALVRWLERVHGIDMEFFRAQLAEEVRDAVRAGASAIKVGSVEFRIVNKRLITVINKSCA